MQLIDNLKKKKNVSSEFILYSIFNRVKIPFMSYLNY